MPKYIIIIMISMALGTGLFSQNNTIKDSYNAESRGEYQAALEIVQNLAVSEPEEPFYQIRIAWLLYLSGKYNEALLAYQKAAQMLDCVDAHTGMINCNLALGNWDQAITIATEMLKVHQQNPLLLSKVAYAAYMKKDFNTSSQYYGRIAELYPWDMDNRGYYVNNLYLAGKLNEAKAEYAKLKKYSPQSQTVADYAGILN